MYIDGKKIKISLSVDGICLEIEDKMKINMTKEEAIAFIKTLQQKTLSKNTVK